MRSITQTQAAEHFDALVEAAERGETVVVTRDGVPIGRFVPERTVAERIAEVMSKYPLDREAAEDFARTIEENRALMNMGSVREWRED
jgi:antitoxin (DNA-binding transcriptional repressor) of toxin-antitoxin stability system